MNPQPTAEEVKKYYNDSYFTERTERGYDNYYSRELKQEISRVFQLNLKDLGFLNWESQGKTEFPNTKFSSLDIGCAAGYFVSFMKERGYDAYGIEIADGPVKFARESLGLSVYQEDFLSWDILSKQKFDVVTLWATIEHLHKPKETLTKIFSHLKPGGVLVLSTCRYGILAKQKGLNWRYLNVPEHLYYYSFKGLKHVLEQVGFQVTKGLSYGSGMTSIKNPTFGFKIRKRFFDWFVKIFNMGDMMVFMAIKKESI